MVTVEALAQRKQLKATVTKGAVEYHGANFIESGATDDGFVLNANGTAWDRTLNKFYKSWEVCKGAELDPKDFEPTAIYMEQNPTDSKGAKGPKKPKVYDLRTLEQRGYTGKTLGHFGIVKRTESNFGVSWIYSTKHPNGEVGRSRCKYLDPNLQLNKYPDKNPAKYKWDRQTEKLGEPSGYNLDALATVDLSKIDLWIVNGEPSVWACYQEGVLAVCPLGESRNLPAFISALVALGVTTAHYVPDNDAAGASAARKVSALALEQGIEVLLHQWALPAETLKKGYDVCDFWEACREHGKPLGPELLALPIAEVAEEEPPEEPKKKNAGGGETGGSCAEQSRRLMRYLDDAGLVLFKTSEGDAFLSVSCGKSPETVNIGSSNFVYLMDDIWRQSEFAPLKKDSIETTSRMLTGSAIRHGETIEVGPRVQARGNGRSQRIYLDLCDKKGMLVEISAGGWRLIQHAEGVHFRRAAGMKPLPVPILVSPAESKEIWQKFKDLMGCGNDRNFILMVSWLLGCLRGPDQPYPALAVSGEQDSGKTEKTKMLRSLVDPNRLELGDIPTDPQNLNITAKNRLVLGYDNLVNIAPWLSDAFCRIATMGCFSMRKHYTNDEEAIFHATRPLLINGIADFMGRPDFQRRCLFVQLPRFGRDGGTKKLAVRKVWKIFYDIQPGILGLLLTAISAAIEHSEDEELEEIDAGEGMVDFAEWVMAAELGGGVPWTPGEFLKAYAESQTNAATSAIDARLPQACQRFVRWMRETKKEIWEGKAGELHPILLTHAAILAIGEEEYEKADHDTQARLRNRGKDIVQRLPKEFPSNGIHLGRELRGIAHVLRENRIFDIQFKPAGRLIVIKLFKSAAGTEKEVSEDEPAPSDSDAPPAPDGLFDGVDDDPFGLDDEE